MSASVPDLWLQNRSWGKPSQLEGLQPGHSLHWLIFHAMQPSDSCCTRAWATCLVRSMLRRSCRVGSSPQPAGRPADWA